MPDYAPIALFVYNRPQHTQRTLDALAANPEAKESILYIFSDGARENPDGETSEKIEAVRKIIRAENRFSKVVVAEQQYNSGLSGSIIGGVRTVVGEHGRIIVLEDDLVTAPGFLKFMNEALDIYYQETEVVCISGYIYPVKDKLPEAFFLRGADCWGWATWKRGWDLFEEDGKKLLDEIESKNLMDDFDFGGSYPYTQMLRDQVNGLNASWAIRWYASAYLKNKLALYPGQSLVQNIGVDSSGTHSGTSDQWGVKLALFSPNVQTEVKENAHARTAVAEFFRNLQRVPFGSRLLRKFARLFS